jgi:hypothetical protein
MNPLLLGPLFELGKGIIDRIFPDPAQKAAAELELMKMTQDGDLKQIMGQLEINAREAQHASVFVAGWRPFFGWAGGFGFIYATIAQPILVWVGATKGWPAPPDVNIDLLWVVVTGMLGLGTLRSVEKTKGVASK